MFVYYLTECVNFFVFGHNIFKILEFFFKYHNVQNLVAQIQRPFVSVTVSQIVLDTHILMFYSTQFVEKNVHTVL